MGSYKMSEKSYFKVFRKDNEIILERTQSLDTPGMQLNLLPYEENKFWVQGQDIRCAFNIDNKEAAESLTLYIGESSITANRIK